MTFVCRMLSSGGCRSIAAFVAAASSGCSSYAPSGLAIGASRAEVMQRMGAPTADSEPSASSGASVPRGTRRLEYARGPYGKHTYLLDFDGDDRLLGWEQVLTEARFHAIRSGMSDREVRAQLGRPAEIRDLRFQSQQVWAYRYEGPFCQWFMVGIDRTGQVVDVSFGPDPLCEAHGPSNYQ